MPLSSKFNRGDFLNSFNDLFDESLELIEQAILVERDPNWIVSNVHVRHNRHYPKCPNYEHIFTQRPLILFVYRGKYFATDFQHRLNYLRKFPVTSTLKIWLIPIEKKHFNKLEPAEDCWFNWTLLKDVTD